MCSAYGGSKNRRGLNSWDPKSQRHGLGALGIAKDQWDPATPRSAWPRGVKAKLLAGSVGLYGERIIGMTAWGANEMVLGQLVATVTGSAGVNLTNNNVGFRRFQRATPASATQDHYHWGIHSIHGYLDPTGPQLGQALVAQDLCYATVSGTVSFLFGWWNTNTSANLSSFVGVAWVGDTATGTWWARVADGTGTPSRVLHSFDSGKSVLSRWRLGIVLDGNTKMVGFYVDGVLVSAFLASAAPDRFGTAGVLFGYGMITAASSTGTMGIFGGGNPRLLSLVEV